MALEFSRFAGSCTAVHRLGEESVPQTQLRTSPLEASSVGALMEQLNQNVLDDLQGAEITLSKA